MRERTEVALLFLMTEHLVKERLSAKEGVVVFPRGRICREWSTGVLLQLELGYYVRS
jgi:hypothetical protein